MKNSTLWIYEYDRKYPCQYELTNVRYVLGQIIDPTKPKALICIGVNPSTALPEDLDATLTRVQAYAEEFDYGSWYMLNLYPQRSTDPNGMDQEATDEIVKKNYAAIRKLFESLQKVDVDIWCAWGDSIDLPKRDYLKEAARQIYAFIQNHPKAKILIKGKDKTNAKLSDLTKAGNPHHPLSSGVSWKENDKFIALNEITGDDKEQILKSIFKIQ